MQLDEAYPGQRQVSAEQWNLMVRLLKRKVTGPDVTELSTGWHISRPPIPRQKIKLITAVVTVLPTVNDESLTVRRVRYTDDPPIVGEYEWDDIDFEAFPDYGASILDYEAFYWSPDEDGNPTLDTPFILTRSEYNVWLALLDQRMERFVIARRFGSNDAGSHFMVIQELAPTRGVPWDGLFRTVGTVKTINVWPTMKAGDFTPFLWEADDLSDEMTVLPLTWWRGGWWLKQRPKWPVSARKGPLKVVDCTGVEVPV